MRLLGLDLERYGHFTDRHLSFREGAKLHLVHGPNEAGKSTALEAITDLFYGIDKATSQGFLHQNRDLRLGATIIGRDGQRLSFRRKIGKKDALIDAAEKPLPDDRLAAFLGGVTREVFERAFGLNAAALRDGAGVLLSSEGDVGASLFSAASGLANLNELRKALEAEADLIFAPRKAKERRFYQALARFEEARAAISKTELRENAWKKLNEEIAERGESLDQIRRDKSLVFEKSTRLLRLKRIAPLIDEIDRQGHELASLQPLPDVAASFTTELATALDAARTAKETLERLEAEAAGALGQQAEIIVDEALLAHQGEVQKLFADTGAYAKARQDLPRVKSETVQTEGTLAAHATLLGLTYDALEARQPTAGLIARLEKLVKTGRQAEIENNTLLKSLATEKDELARLTREMEARGKVADPAPLRETFEALRPVFSQAKRRGEIDQEIRAETTALAEAALRLDPPIDDLDHLARSSLPASATLTKFQKSFDDSDAKIRRVEDRLNDAKDSIATLEKEMARLCALRPVPSRDAIAHLRNRRDAHWLRLKDALFHAPQAPSGASLMREIADFEVASHEADRLADAANEDAERVAAYAHAQARLDEAKQKATDGTAELDRLRADQAALMQSWTELFAPLLIPKSPAEMQGWLTKVETLLQKREALQRQAAALAALDESFTDARPSLANIAAKLGLDDMVSAELGLLAARIETRLRQLEDGLKQALGTQAAQANAATRVAKLEAEKAKAEAAVAQWNELWCQAVDELGLKADATLEETEAALDVWKGIPGLIEKRNGLAKRVEGMQRDINQFEALARPLIETLAADLARLPEADAIKTLHERLDAAGKAQSQRQECGRRITKLQKDLRGAEETLHKAQERLEKLAALAQSKSESLVDLLPRLQARDASIEACAQKRRELSASAEGRSEEDLRAELQNFDRDRVDAELAMLAEESERMDRASNEVFAAQDALKKERERLEKGTGAELAWQQRRNAEAELREAAKDWAILKIGARLIDHALETNRAKHQDPLLSRAGEIFACLTGKAWTGLRQEFDEKDQSHLAGCTPSGGSVLVGNMSEGTRDQLYLSLRLSFLEDYAERAESTPFVGDDLFASFDDARTRHGLLALAAISPRVQPILFTHHRHVVEIGRECLGADLDVIELGGA
jgi:uncharacterized protein YhaN